MNTPKFNTLLDRDVATLAACREMGADFQPPVNPQDLPEVVRTIPKGGASPDLSGFLLLPIGVEGLIKPDMIWPQVGNSARFTDVTSNTTGGFGLWRQASLSFNPNPATVDNGATCDVTGEDGAATNWEIIHGRSAGGLSSVFTLYDPTVPPPNDFTAFGATVPILQLYNYIGSQIISPVLTHGAGTVYFASRIYGDNQTATLSVDVSYETPPVVWVSKGKIQHTAAKPTLSVPVQLAINDRDVKRVRIYRETGTGTSSSTGLALTTGAVLVDNILITGWVIP